MSAAAAASLERLVAAREIVVICGPGGVGKTTTAAALATGAAIHSRARVLVLTVDPARRLADALGVQLGDEPQRVDVASTGTRRVRGELHAAMLDARSAWDALIGRHARSARDAAEILANPLYVNLTQRFALSHEYIAMERLYELERAGEWDLLVIDTPPSQNALDFLDAPERMTEFFSLPLLRWLIAPRRSRLFDYATRPFYQVADRLLGTQLLEDVSRFFVLFNSMHDGFVERARAVGGLVRSDQATFAVVSTLEAAPVAESRRLCRALEQRGLDVGLVVANRALPSAFADPRLEELAERLRSAPDRTAGALAGDRALAGMEPAQVERVLREIGTSFENYRLVAQREEELLSALGRGRDVVARVPDLGERAARLDGVRMIADELFASG